MSAKLPFNGLKFCCTGVEARTRKEIMKSIKALGGIQYDDLMTDVQYLIVGNRNTPKYKFCVKKRLDIVFLAEDAVLRIYEKWLMGEEQSSLQLEHYRLPVFSGISACISRTDISRTQLNRLFGQSSCRGKSVGTTDYFSHENLSKLVTDNGGNAKESLSNDHGCMISSDPRGTRYNKALEWKIPVVHPIWVFDSILRGAALDLADYGLSQDSKDNNVYDTGCEVWVEIRAKHAAAAAAAAAVAASSSSSSSQPSLTRPRRTLVTPESEDLTKGDVPRLSKESNRDMWNSVMDHTNKAPQTNDANNKNNNNNNNSNNNNLWDEESASDNEEDEIVKENHPEEMAKKNTSFLGFNFLLVGFNSRESDLLKAGIEGFSGEITRDERDCLISHIIIPARNGSQASTLLKKLPSDVKSRITNGDIKVVTEFFIERCIYYKKVILDSWGQPIKGLIPSTRKFQVCTSGFTGIELLHVEKLIRFINFEYCETLSSQRDLLILNVNLFKDTFAKNLPKLYDYKHNDVLNCPVYQSGQSSVSSLSAKNKIDASKKWSIPIVSIAFLWEMLEISKYKPTLMMPDISNPRWCVYFPINYSRPKSLLEYIKSMSGNHKSTNSEALPHGGGAGDNEEVRLPSPRKLTPRKKYGRIVGRSPQSMKLAPSRENSCISMIASVNGAENGPEIEFDLTKDDEDVSQQVRYEDAESVVNQERLLEKLQKRQQSAVAKEASGSSKKRKTRSS
ncbi:uncharacterized protein LODBEIA_P38240 [Lodderomyces beijingensis]|uniref:BRCT domain-containing protein n=1 Tax=Lodderomyces beijingensis TaxID=1775926 RepID=A0ABP0ZTW3_9ASCO